MSKKDKIRGLLERNPGAPMKDNPVKQELIQDINTGIQDNVDTEKQESVPKKKATFDLDAELHMRLKIFSASQGKKMVEVVEEALKQYMDAQVK